MSLKGYKRRNTKFFHSTNGKIGIILKPEDYPKQLKKIQRRNNVIKNDIDKRTKIIKKMYAINHPIVRLFDKNLKHNSIYNIIFNDGSKSKIDLLHRIGLL